MNTQFAKGSLDQVFEGEKHEQLEQSQPMNQGIDDIDFDSLERHHRLYGSPFF